ncbi:hypothetical protein ACLOJK_005645 [Asimina triloba]
MEVGAVAAMRYVKDGIQAAKLVMEHTKHTLLVGEQASVFAISMGLPGPTNLSSAESIEKWVKWKQNLCQPNFWKNVIPQNGCGPYHPTKIASAASEDSCGSTTQRTYCSGSSSGDFALSSNGVSYNNHDTISMVVIDKAGHIAVGTSTNGATFKIPGRVGDGPIAGSSAYADDDVGACGATGDGDIMMRFLPCYQVVESMRLGMDPKRAADDAISRIARKYPDFVGAVVAVNKKGAHAGACYGWTFKYSVRSSGMEDVQRPVKASVESFVFVGNGQPTLIRISAFGEHSIALALLYLQRQSCLVLTENGISRDTQIYATDLSQDEQKTWRMIRKLCEMDYKKNTGIRAGFCLELNG